MYNILNEYNTTKQYTVQVYLRSLNVVSVISLWLEIHWSHLDQTDPQFSSGHPFRHGTRWRICPCLSLWAQWFAATAALPPLRSLYGQRKRWPSPCQRDDTHRGTSEDTHCTVCTLRFILVLDLSTAWVKFLHKLDYKISSYLLFFIH